MKRDAKGPRSAGKWPDAASNFKALLGSARALFARVGRLVTQPRQRQEAASEARFCLMLDTVPALLWTTGRDHGCTYVNKRWLELTGRTMKQALGDGWAECVHPDDRQRCLDTRTSVFEAHQHFTIQYRLRRHDGEYRWVLDEGIPLYGPDGELSGYIGSCVDITERKQAEKALIHGQKMQTVGQLTGGVAHDFNNLLTIISGNLQMLQDRIKEDEFLRHLLEAASQAAACGTDLVRMLLAFSSGQALKSEPLDLSHCLAGLMPLLQRTLGEHIAIVTVTGTGIWIAQADPAQVETALLNLALNARDAMPQGGRLTLEIANAVLDEGYAAREAEVTPGEYVMLAVSDAGTGMTEEVRSRAFEPFFTTKGVGQGSGLGLSMVYGFAQRSRGHAKIESELGHGTTVKLYLPRARSALKYAEKERAPTVEDLRGGETILVVEDEAGVRELAIAFLTDLGYRVLEAPDGPVALKIVQKEPSIDLLFVDLVLAGGMNGVDLAAETERRHSHLKVLYTSGYPRDAVVFQGLYEGAQVLAKPYQREHLAHAVRTALEG